MKSLILTSCILLSPAVIATGADHWEVQKDEFLEHARHQPATAKHALKEIVRLADDDSRSFLEEVFARPQETRGGLYARYPEEDFRHAGSYRGIAQAGLAALGDEQRWRELFEESFHESEVVRENALQKIILIETDSAIEALSNFIGDSEEGGEVLEPIEWKALFELTDRLEDPPYPVRDFRDLHPGYYQNGGREKWLRWRYENFGPIPGREELFAQFGARAAAASTSEREAAVRRVSSAVAPADEEGQSLRNSMRD